jgi:hypothetical protein
MTYRLPVSLATRTHHRGRLFIDPPSLLLSEPVHFSFKLILIAPQPRLPRQITLLSPSPEEPPADAVDVLVPCSNETGTSQPSGATTGINSSPISHKSTESSFGTTNLSQPKYVLEQMAGLAHALVVNSGCANAVTGREGHADAWAMACARCPPCTFLITTVIIRNATSNARYVDRRHWPNTTYLQEPHCALYAWSAHTYAQARIHCNWWHADRWCQQDEDPKYDLRDALVVVP